MKCDPAEEAVVLAEEMLRESLAGASPVEKAQMQRIARMISHPAAKNLSLAMTDRIGRSCDPVRSLTNWRSLLDRFGLEKGFSIPDLAMLEAGRIWSRFFPGLVHRAVTSRLKSESRDVILAADDEELTRYLAEQSSTGTRINLNQLGEAVLGEKEALKRLEATVALLEREDVDYVSVKISAIFSQINLVAWEDSLEIIKERLRVLYRAAMPKGKFVNLDMEAYHDLELTIAAFREVLSEDEFSGYYGGIALQAYLPDSIAVQRELTAWARLRFEKSGQPVKIRLVKGANLAMESVEAEIHGWNSPPHTSKLESDACFKRMLEFACDPDHAEVVRVGVGSHNLFDVALALVLREQNGVEDWIEIEMIQGMAPAQARVVRNTAESLLLYSPIVAEEEYGSALAYLIRRLDENTAPGNFLAALFSLEPGSDDWNAQRDSFLEAWRMRSEVISVSKRETLPEFDRSKFQNEPDTDWTRVENRLRLRSASPTLSEPPEAGATEVEAALDVALKAREAWRETGESRRAEILCACGDRLATSRFESISILQEFGKKAPMEADSEISEAVDFARYYAETGRLDSGVKAESLGTVVIAPPWNFPFAIPCGGVLAALMAGNTVILKPAPESVLIGWWLVQQLWAAGVPKDALQFVACSDGEVGRRLIDDSRTSAVVLTGAFETARRFQDWRPSLKLFAETSGKNALVVSALADRELAAADLVKSAFGHSGQKCSAASLGILEAEVYDDEGFFELLKDAAASLKVGPATDLSSKVTPLVQSPGETLIRALTTLDEGEEWLLKPEVSADDPCLWSPGIKLGVESGSWFHQTECFGPVLGLMKAGDLREAVELQNSVDYGLTAGFHSLDESENEWWKERVQAGNLYINRGTTGAIVQRQPFGGWKNSSIGPGSKAGGPNYVDLFRTVGASQSAVTYKEAWRDHFAREHDPSGLKCESNLFRYRSAGGVILRLSETDGWMESMAREAAEITGTKLMISLASKETAEELAERIADLADCYKFLRTVGQVPDDSLLRAAYASNLNWIDAPISADGRIELTRWLREQSISETRHRYGNLLPERS